MATYCYVGLTVIMYTLIIIKYYVYVPHYGPGVDSASKRNEYQEYFLRVKATGE